MNDIIRMALEKGANLAEVRQFLADIGVAIGAESDKTPASTPQEVVQQATTPVDQPAAIKPAVPVSAPSKPGRVNGWTAEQEAMLIEMRQAGLGRGQIARKLGRSIDAVKQRIRDLRMRGFVVEPHPGNGELPLTGAAPRKPPTTRYVAYRSNQPWSTEEVDILTTLWRATDGTVTERARFVSKKIGRTACAVADRAFQLGLTRRKSSQAVSASTPVAGNA